MENSKFYNEFHDNFERYSEKVEELKALAESLLKSGNVKKAREIRKQYTELECNYSTYAIAMIATGK